MLGNGRKPKLLQELSRVRFALTDLEALLFRVSTRLGMERFPRWLARNPKTFYQHVRWRMTHDRNPLYVTLADKIESKKYVADRIGEGYTVATIAVGGNSAEIDFSALPRNYAVKVNHASGGVILVSDKFPRGSSLPPAGRPFDRFRLHPDDVDFKQLGEVLDDWLKATYGARKAEWAYSEVEPRILVEEYLENPTPFPPTDYKFFVFGGRCELVRLVRHSSSRSVLFHFDRRGKALPVHFASFAQPLQPLVQPIPQLPDRFLEMRSLAESVGRDFDFVRVDMFELEGRIVIGELTLYPSAGGGRIHPKRFDDWLGAAWPKHEEATVSSPLSTVR